jgi:hypothetical protein
MELAHQGVEAATHFLKWLQFPEANYRLEEGAAAPALATGRPVVEWSEFSEKTGRLANR